MGHTQTDQISQGESSSFILSRLRIGKALHVPVGKCTLPVITRRQLRLELLQSFCIHTIVIHPNLLMCSCHLSSTVLQNHAIIVWLPCYLAMSFAYILKFGNSFPFSPSLFIPAHFLANPLLGFQLSGNDFCLCCWVSCDLLGVLSFTNHAE